MANVVDKLSQYVSGQAVHDDAALDAFASFGGRVRLRLAPGDKSARQARGRTGSGTQPELAGETPALRCGPEVGAPVRLFQDEF